ncbi:hypothetical protein GZ77_24075 [Endozoicomonas montiporae]|uniref:Glycosyltransferase 2-like domain-containing protein n=2 Tax=Endozoicomonas montiporae TaxID=1027273 RepID=A0A081MZI1_9GAMM|nr:glycosyltransferase family 2 protein [Endozoicomonas montiporae]AMO54714.1 hypothetical protein EZMO1_0463 [Endozoicomonas montiporae CL-33]KEQ11604.1 hypothetical protein GZ77_24075 [Endozoicomonas montiporae]
MNDKTVLFSIVIPAYNYAHFLPETVESILQQTYSHYEIIIVNDGSTDNTDEVVHELISQHPNKTIKYLVQENAGLSATRNNGANIARGDYLFFLDSDDKLLPDALDSLHKTIRQHPEAGFIIGRYYSVDNAGKRKARCLWNLTGSKVEDFKTYALDNKKSMLSSCVLHKKDVFLKYYFHEHLRQSEDEPLFSHLLANENVVKIDEYVSEIRKHENSHRTKVYPDLAEMLTDAVFDSDKLPANLMGYKSRFRALKHLEEFRSLFLNGSYTEALEEYKTGFKFDKKAALKPNYFRKAVKAWVKQ